MEPFDERHNVVVGLNGSGKSNFFNAIQFVLSDEYSHLNEEQRRLLLHESSGPKIITAFVEIIFDNSDARVPIEHEVIYLRRTIDTTKDQYLLNKKVVHRAEVMNLLESAGFSSSNPYYIVKQGKIMQLATASDTQRLKLLREVAGAKVYEKRKTESDDIVKETKEKIKKLQENLDGIEKRLSDLQTQKEELKQYSVYEKNKRVLEYIIYESELTTISKKYADLEKQRSQSSSEQKQLAANHSKMHEDIKLLTKKIKDMMEKLCIIKDERDIISNDHQHLIKEKTKLECIIKDLSEEILGDNKSKERAENELARLTQTIREKEAELGKIKPLYEEKKAREEECTRELSLKEQKRKELYAKEGRGSQFATKKDRDRWIQNELKSLNKQIKDKKDHKDKLEADLKRDAQNSVDLQKTIEEQSQELEIQKSYIEDYNKDLYDLKKNKDQFQATRNDLWRKENNLQANLSSLKEDVARATQQLRSIVGNSTLNGLNSVKKVLNTFISRGGEEADIAKQYYGPFIENFECQENIYTAVEVTAKNRLFHLIVDNDKVATMILKEMNRQNLPGEVNFMPLNRLNVGKVKNPNEPDAVHMITKLHYDSKFDKAIRFVIGNTLICRNMDAATKLARRTRFNCVTLDGDQVSSKGALTGGYFDPSKSSLKIYGNREKLILQMRQCVEELKILGVELAKIDSSFNTVVADMQKTETRNAYAKGMYERVKGEQRLLKEELLNIDKFRGPKESSLAQCKWSLETMQTTKEGLEAELHQELLSVLSVADQQQVDMLNDDIQRLQREHKKAFSDRMNLEAEKNKLENFLTNNLIKKRDDVLNALQEILLEDRNSQLTNCESEVEEIDKKIEKVNKELNSMENKVKEMTEKLTHKQTELEMLRELEKKTQDMIGEELKHLEKLSSKYNLLGAKLEELGEKIHQCGAFPAQNLYNQFAKMSPKALLKKLEETNNQLKKFSHVNKKAVEQFISYYQIKENMQEKITELEKGGQKIQEVLEVLEQQKVEAILFTFKQIGKQFTKVFKKLVPAGTVKLVLKEAHGGEEEDITPEDGDTLQGIGVKVSFTEAEVEMKEMNQLSGGQKTLVALALIFAIQKCDPAPFYLFDEVDQALDAQHRKTVANMIGELSNDAQFITTTFRPELLDHAHKFYGVKFRNKVSHIDCVTREEAKDFIEDEETED